MLSRQCPSFENRWLDSAISSQLHPKGVYDHSSFLFSHNFSPLTPASILGVAEWRNEPLGTWNIGEFEVVK